ncbi:MAG TPA: MFS transporter [Opitutaceae bacterium]
MTGCRWKILALVFAATTINYLDRTVLGVLAPVLQYKVFHWTDETYATVTIAFQAAYAIGLVGMGAVLDRFGTRAGYALSIALWSLFDFLHAAIRPARSAVTFPLVRFGFGLVQAGTYPAGVKAVAEWFPRKERALATGIFNAGSNMGAVLAPLFVAWAVSVSDGAHWQWAFLGTGTLSAFCAVAWWQWYRRPAEMSGVSASERLHIESDGSTDRPAERIRWRAILPQPETWAFAVGKTTDIAWWFYTFWVGKFLFDQYGLGVRALAAPLAAIFIAADAGSIGGGWLSTHFLKRGWSLNAARKSTLLLCALLALPVGLATYVGSCWIAVALIALAAAAHQAWSATIFTFVSDVFPNQAVASVAGVGGMVGALAGILANLFLGKALSSHGTGGYSYMFLAAGGSYLAALGVMQILSPRLAPVDLATGLGAS